MNEKILMVLLLSLLTVGYAHSQNWELVWSDEFDGTELNLENWTPVNAGTGFGNQEKQYYSSRPENLKLENGYLVITALLENYKVGTASWNYTSAKISTQNKKDFTYGKIEARIKLPKGAGTWPAFWTLGYGSWPAAGEIDIMEYVGRTPNEIQCNIHTKDYNGRNGLNRGQKKTVPNVADDFHTYGIEWTSDKIKFYFDGEHYWSYSALSVNEANYPFVKPQYFILNLAIGGTMGGAVDDNIFPQQMIVDYVKVYKDASLGVDNQTIAQKPEIPSLFSDNLTLTFPNESASERMLSLVDLTGKAVIKKKITEMTTEIRTTLLMRGMYFVRIQEGKKSYVQKVIKL